MLASIRQTIEALLSPVSLVYMSLIFGLFVARKSAVKAVLWWSIGILTLFSTALFPYFATKSLESQYPRMTELNKRIKTIVVLSGGQADIKQQPADMVLYASSVKRLLAGVRLWRQIPEAMLVVSGGGYGHQMPEAKNLFDLARLAGVPKQFIHQENRSLNTEAQVRELKVQLGTKPFYLVTSAIHMPRSMVIFHSAGLKPIPIPTDYTYFWQDERWQKRLIPNANNLVYSQIAIHEYLGRIWFRLKICLKKLFVGV